jgi:chromosomal replication initiation ATPase DnaA
LRGRAICVQLIRELTQPCASYQKIGRELGARDHSTIVALDRRAHNLMNAFADLFDRRQAILRRLGIG